MNIITCICPEADIYDLKKNNQKTCFFNLKTIFTKNITSDKTPFFSSEINLVNQENLKNKNYVPVFYVKNIKMLIYFLYLFIGISFLFCCSFYIPLVKFNFGFSSIEKISFWDDACLENSMQNYIMPQTENKDELSSNFTDTDNIIPAVNFQNYTVKKGDSISGIALKFGLKNMGTIISANGISNAKKLQTGNILRIPSSDGVLHNVKKGETLNSIADKFDLPVTILLDANDLETPHIKEGQNIFIPGAVIGSFELKKALGELFIYPIHGRLTSPFGYRRDPFTGRLSFHTGIDLAAPIGTHIKSTLDGTISGIGVSRIYGNYITISHGNGYQSMYGHLHTVNVKRGQKVAQGSIIGTVGNTGRSTGPHVHFSLYKNGKLIDPLHLLK